MSGDAKLRWAMCAMGAWLAGTIFVSIVAVENFYTIDRLLAASPNDTFHSLVARLGHSESRDLLRYLSSELNRLYFQVWNVMQLALGLLVLWLLMHQPVPGKARLAVAGMLAAVVVMVGWLTPAIASLGRSLDFVPRDPSPPGMNRFWILHGAYTLLELLSLAAGGVATAWIARAARKVW